MSRHYIKVYNKALDSEICQKIIDKFDQDPRKAPGKTASGYRPDLKICTDLHTSLSGWKELDHEIFKAINVTYRQYCADCSSIQYAVDKHPIVDTGYQIQKYEPNGEDQFKWHIDAAGDAETSSRILAAILYLNDVEEGGETEFMLNGDESYSVKPEAGRVIWFPPYFPFPHRGKIAISGPKYIVTTFITYKKDKEVE